MKYHSFVSKKQMEGRTGAVSGLHCGEGHSAFVYTVDTLNDDETGVSVSDTASSTSVHTGGRKKRNTLKHRGKKRKQTTRTKCVTKTIRKHKRVAEKPHSKKRKQIIHYKTEKKSAKKHNKKKNKKNLKKNTRKHRK